MTPPTAEALAMGTVTRRSWPRAWWDWCVRAVRTWEPMRDLNGWPPVPRLEAALRAMVRTPTLLDEDPLHEISLYVDRHNKIHVHHPQAQTQEQLILVANVLLKASQVVAAQAGAQVVSQAPRQSEGGTS